MKSHSKPEGIELMKGQSSEASERDILKESKININKHYTYCQPAGSATLICMVTISTTNTNLSTSNATRFQDQPLGGKSDQTPREIAAFFSGRIQDDPNKSSPFNDSNQKKNPWSYVATGYNDWLCLILPTACHKNVCCMQETNG